MMNKSMIRRLRTRTLMNIVKQTESRISSDWEMGMFMHLCVNIINLRTICVLRLPVHRSACEEVLYARHSSILYGYREYKEDCLSEMHPLHGPLLHEQHRFLSEPCGLSQKFRWLTSLDEIGWDTPIWKNKTTSATGSRKIEKGR
jgi:hypothetical protein